jgi:RNA polymerase sigma factor (sigma-70 family)
MSARRQERTDAQLIRDARTDPAAFGEIYRRHAPAVHEWLRRRTAHTAADLTAETFAQAWLSRRKFRDHRQGSALPWLLGIAHNCWCESARCDRVETKARERLGLPLDLAAEAGYEDVDRRLSPETDVTAALATLPEHERRAVELRVVDELPYEEVARRLSIRPAAARLRVSRALRRLNVALPHPEEEL